MSNVVRKFPVIGAAAALLVAGEARAQSVAIKG